MSIINELTALNYKHMIIEYKIACDNCTCIINGITTEFLRVYDEDREITFDYCDTACEAGDTCPDCSTPTN